MTHLFTFGFGFGGLVLAIHYLGARGTTFPGIGGPDGRGLYSRIWPLDTLNHFLSGVALAALVMGVLGSTVASGVAAVGIVFMLAVAWEGYEALYWHEIEGSGGLRRWFEDTQADVLAVVTGGILTAAVELGGPAYI